MTLTVDGLKEGLTRPTVRPRPRGSLFRHRSPCSTQMRKRAARSLGNSLPSAWRYDRTISSAWSVSSVHDFWILAIRGQSLY